MRARQIDGVDAEDISDERVVRSFTESVKEGGFMCKYLQLAQLGVIIGDALYVHGGVISDCYADGQVDCLGMVPWKPVEYRMDDLEAWIDELNAWKAAQVAEWLERPTGRRRRRPVAVHSLKGWDARGGQMLMDYAVTNCYPSVVLGRHLGPKSMGATCRSTSSRGRRERHPPNRRRPHPARQLPVGPHPGEPAAGHLAHRGRDGRHAYPTWTSPTTAAAPSRRSSSASGQVCVRGVLQNMASIQYTLAPLRTAQPAGPPAAPLPGAAEKKWGTGLLPRNWRDDLDALKRLEPEVDFDGGTIADRRFVKARLAETGDLLMCHVSGFKYSLLSPDEARLRPAGARPADGAHVRRPSCR